MFKILKHKSPLSKQTIQHRNHEPYNEEDLILRNDNMMMLQQLERNILFVSNLKIHFKKTLNSTKSSIVTHINQIRLNKY